MTGAPFRPVDCRPKTETLERLRHDAPCATP